MSKPYSTTRPDTQENLVMQVGLHSFKEIKQKQKQRCVGREGKSGSGKTWIWGELGRVSEYE